MRKKSIRFTNMILAALVLTGCTTTVQDPVLIGKNTYMISVSHTAFGSGLTSHSDLRRQALVAANKFCTSKGQELQVDSLSGSGVAGFGSIDDTVNFMCLDHASPVQLRQTPNAVIEVQKQ